MLIANTFLGGQAAAPGGTDVTPAPVSWGNISGHDPTLASKTTNAVTISGIDAPINLKATYSGSADLYPVKNGVTGAVISSGGSISVVNTDTLAFTASSYITASGTVTVQNTSDVGSPTLGSFTYSLTIKDFGD